MIAFIEQTRKCIEELVANCPAVFLAYFSLWICYDTQLTNTKIKMYKTRQLSITQESIKYLSKLVTELEFVKSFAPIRFQKKFFFLAKN